MININIEELECQKNICGNNNLNIKTIEDIYNVSLDLHGGRIITNCTDELLLVKINRLIKLLYQIALSKYQISPRDIIYISKCIDKDLDNEVIKLYTNRKAFAHTYNNKPMYPKTIKQVEYLHALDNYDLVFSVGAAGTGKTYLTVVHAVNMLKKGYVKKLILTRPAVEAGESLGFLPGDLKEKIDPYLRPLYDALYDMLGVEQTQNLIDKQIIEIAPLAYMRGRTLENAYVILDEAQNTTSLQMKMFLTRIGFNSKMVITGDISQIDLPRGKTSGLIEAKELLKNIKDIKTITFDAFDCVRHPLVAQILSCYEKPE